MVTSVTSRIEIVPRLRHPGFLRAGDGSGFVGFRVIFDRHVLEFAGFKDVAAFQTLDVLGVLITAHNLHARVLTLFHVPSLFEGSRRRLGS